MSSEHSVASAKASVMIYDDANKKWIPSGTSSGLSKVHIYQHTVNNTFRVVGRKIQGHEVVINCAILKGVKYNQATPTFHQWRDNRQIYGLNFTNRDDAENFALAMIRALEILSQNSSSNYRSLYHTQPLYHTIGPSGVSLDEYAEYRGCVRTNSENNQIQQSTEYGQYASNSIISPSNHTPPNNLSTPGGYGHHRTSSAPQTSQPQCVPPQPVAQITSPPPPPPPPPVDNLSGFITLPRQNAKPAANSNVTPISLASALASAKLKKTPQKNDTNSANNDKINDKIPLVGNMASIMDEMTRTLARRRAQAENNLDRDSTGSNDSGNMGDKNISGNGTSPVKSSTDSHKSGSSDGDSRLQIVDAFEMDRIKQEIMNEMKKEMIKMKQEIIDAIRIELNRR